MTLAQLLQTSPTVRERLFAKIDKRGDDECWPWKGAVGKCGYPQIRIGDKIFAAHRVSYVVEFGHLEDADDLLHSCDFPLCCNAAHTGPGTHKENMNDCANKQRNHSPRPGNGRQKLSLTDRARIFLLFKEGKNKSEIARCMNVTPTRIRQILKEGD